MMFYTAPTAIRAIAHRAVDDIGVAGDPADIGGAKINVAVLVVEDVFVCGRGIDHITADGVLHAFRFAGGAGSVEDKERVLGVHLLAGAVGIGVSH
jgi:hypothetical protein